MTKPISPLRQRVLDDMARRNMSPNTQKVYTQAVANYARHFGRSPAQLGIAEVRQYRPLPLGLDPIAHRNSTAFQPSAR